MRHGLKTIIKVYVLEMLCVFCVSCFSISVHLGREESLEDPSFAVSFIPLGKGHDVFVIPFLESVVLWERCVS